MEDHRPAFARLRYGQLHIVVAKPLERLPDAPGLAELREEERDRLLHAAVRVLDHLARSVQHVARRKARVQLTAPGLIVPPLVQPHAQDLELHHTHRCLDAQDHVIVHATDVVDALLVGKERPEHLAHLHEPAKILVRAQKARKLAAEDDADLTKGHGAKQPLETLPPLGRHRGARAKIDIDDLDVAEPKRSSPVGKGVLKRPALHVVSHLTLR